MSSGESDFNYDFGVSFTEADRAAGRASYNYGLNGITNSPDMFGVSIFARDDAGDIFHTYSTYRRGVELLVGAFNWLDLVPKGRNEDAGTMSWVRLHDEYADGPNPNRVRFTSDKRRRLPTTGHVHVY